MATKAQWKIKFESYWYNGSSNATYANFNSLMVQCNSNGEQQQHYYAAWAFEAGLAAWRATGDNRYLDDLIEAIEAVISTATVRPAFSGGPYLGWNAVKGTPSAKGYALWESYLWRYVATMLRVMYKSPALRATGSYQTKYDTILSFIRTHIWEKWYTDGIGNLYRTNTHMASHWARIGMELHVITGVQQYKDVFDDISWRGMAIRGGANLRGRIYNLGAGYSWYSSWTSNTVQDTNHGSDVINFIVEAVENGYYWNMADIDKFVTTFSNVIWYNNSPVQWTNYVNGSGTGGAVNLHEWLNLARYSTSLQSRIDTVYYPIATPGGNLSQGPGVILLNIANLEGSVVYPEGETPGDTIPPIVTSFEVQELTTTSFKLRWYLNEGSKGWVQFGASPGVYDRETVHENSFPTTHGQTLGAGINLPALSPNTTYYFRFYVEDAYGNSGYSPEYSQTTLSDGTPIITLVGSPVINLNLGDVYTELGATWNDGVDSGAATIGGDTVNTAIQGTYIIQYTYPGATTILRTVIVNSSYESVGIGVHKNLFWSI